MKKKIFWTLAASFLLCVSAFAFGCNNNIGSESSSDSSIGETLEKETNLFEDGCYLLADFENYEQVTQVKNGWSLGKITMIAKTMPTDIVYGKHLIEVTDNTEMITHGNQCIKVEILGKEELWGKQDPYLGFKTNGTYFQKYDFSDCESILADVYNATDKPITTYFYIHDSRYESLHTLKPYQYKITLQPGMNELEIPLDMGIFAYSPVDGIFSNIGELGFIFDRGELHQETQVFYMDNLRAKKK